MEKQNLRPSEVVLYHHVMCHDSHSVITFHSSLFSNAALVFLYQQCWFGDQTAFSKHNVIYFCEKSRQFVY